jgi:predicted Rossmann fold nucleotide-binding protein DprA/Smf involved in DNA uptake
LLPEGKQEAIGKSAGTRAIISEFPLRTHPAPENFPVRNRIVVGMPLPIDGIVERSGLNSSEVLATLFDLEMRGIVRQSPGKQFSKVLL